MKTTKRKINQTIGALIVLCIAQTSLNAQNTSYYPDNQGIGGNENAAFGPNALLSNIGTDNTAGGFQAMYSNYNGWFNVAIGREAMYSNYNAARNTALGNRAMYYNDNSHNALGNDNTAIGHWAMVENVDGYQNTALGSGALRQNVNGLRNTAAGFEAMLNNTTNDNCAFGWCALRENQTGVENTAIGYQSQRNQGFSGAGNANDNTSLGYMTLNQNLNGDQNTAIGAAALRQNLANNNSACGFSALEQNTNGYGNTAMGSYCMQDNSNGTYNTATGQYALMDNTSGGLNSAFGVSALIFLNGGSGNCSFGVNSMYNSSTGDENCAFGAGTLWTNTTGSRNTGMGAGSLSSNSTGTYNSGLGYGSNLSAGNLTNATAIGYNAVSNASNKIRFGNSAVTVVEGPVAYTTSDARFKTAVKDEVKGLEFIKRLRPVVYNFDGKKFTEFLTKNMPDSTRKMYLSDDFKASTAIRQSGFIAQEVEKAAQESGYDFNGVHKPTDENDNYSLAYAQFVVPLVKAVQEQQQMIDDQKQAIEKLQQQLKTTNQVQINNSSEISTGISDVAAGMQTGFDMDAKPNPFSNETVVTFTMPQNSEKSYLSICDLSGKQIIAYTIEPGSNSVKVTSEKLNAGIYIYSIISGNTILGSKRMVVAQK